MNRMPEGCRPAGAPGFTAKQGQYLAFVHAYTLVTGRPPAEADLQRFFQVTPPSVHQMALTLERSGLIRRQPGTARSIKVLVEPDALPTLRPSQDQLVTSSVQRYEVPVFSQGRQWRCRSRRCCRASPSRLQASTVRKIISPG
jgi:SOS-response transcriptional repressor LexA